MIYVVSPNVIGIEHRTIASFDHRRLGERPRRSGNVIFVVMILESYLVLGYGEFPYGDVIYRRRVDVSVIFLGNFLKR